MKRILSLLIVAALWAGLLAGCGSMSAPADESSIPVETAVASVSEPEEESIPETDIISAEPQETESASEETAPEPEPVIYELPLTDTPTTFTTMTSAPPGFMAVYLGPNGSYNEAECTRYFAEQTGITIEFHEVDMFAFGEQFNLMIASGDYPDFVSMDYYSGGLTKALDDDVIIDFTDYVQKNMPAFRQRIDGAGLWREIMNDEGQILSIPSLNSEDIVDRGPVIRGDWLEKLGMDEPRTYDDMCELGKAALNQFDISYAYFFNSQLTPSITFSAGFDLPVMDISTTGYHLYQEDGVVKSALADENLRDYLQLLHQWYADGLLSRDFFNAVGMEVKAAFAGDACFGCWDNADFITEDNRDAELMAKGFHAIGVPVPVREEGQKLHFNLGMNGLVQGGVSITTACEDPELLAKVFDYSFTDEGAMISNYGVEGISYELNSDGKPTWTEAMTTAEDRTFRAAIMPYVFSGLPTVVDMTRYWSETFDDDAYHALDLWTGADTDKSRDLPSALYFTTDEAAIFSTKITDVETYANEYMLSCITGDADIDATWDSFVDTVWSLGLQDCLDAEQSAYDRYLTRGETGGA